MNITLARLERSLGYVFQTPALGWQALTHRSHSAQHNERLEFLGDAALNLIAADWLYHAHPDWDEGQLSRVRSMLVNRHALRWLAEQHDVLSSLRLGEGELKGGNPESIRADAMEALIGAVYLDGGWEAVRTLVNGWMVQLMARQAIDAVDKKDAKTALQEWLQARQYPLPTYRLLGRQGPDHAPRFKVHCLLIVPQALSEGLGKSRREAEQQAAQAMMKQLGATE